MEEKDVESQSAHNNGQAFGSSLEGDFGIKHALVSVIVKKTEKIATALYMVTDYVSDAEPLRFRLRTLAVTLISATRLLGAHSSEPQHARSEEIQSYLAETIVLLDLAATIGIVSSMNAEILKHEIKKVEAELIRHYRAKPSLVRMHPGYANVLLSPSMFDIASAVPDGKITLDDNGHKGQDKIDSVLYKNSITTSKNTESFSRKNELGIKIARRNDVLNVVRSKGIVSIKDIAIILKDISEKTIQRELFSLVHEGVLAKEGEKRWSTYRIAR